MTSVASSSDNASPDPEIWKRLHPRIQQWIWKKRWTELHDVQARAIPAILDHRDVILAAPTAGGKTEAAFLPICSLLADDPGQSFRVLYIGPLKALINDQADRLEDLCDGAGIVVHKRHGDASALRKAEALRNPSGILLTTPESLEALFIIHGARIPELFRDLAYVVVDELHAFIGEERGRQVQSQLNRLDLALRRRVPRAGLSATLGDLSLAAAALRPEQPSEVLVIEAGSAAVEIRILLRGYLRPRRLQMLDGAEDSEEDERIPRAIPEDLFHRLRGSNNLVFANSRANVERLSDVLRDLSESSGVRNEFFPHHGSLSKELRHDVERDLKFGDESLSAICTSTLEMGIDIGAVKNIAQVGSPPSVASLKQRVGRSGRRENQPQILRGYVTEDETRPDSNLGTKLRLGAFQFCAMIDLMLDKWSEPPRPGVLHLSTLVQQTLSVIAQVGGAPADQLWIALCDRGPFREVSAGDFATFLRGLKSHDLIVQLGSGELYLGRNGERLVEHFDFYAAFKTADEWRIVANGRTLGSIPLRNPMVVGHPLLFAGRRWQIVSVDVEDQVVGVVPSKGRRIAGADSGEFMIHDVVRRRMKALYLESGFPAYCDDEARMLLMQGRQSFMQAGLFENSMVPEGDGTTLVVWKSSVVANTVALMLQREGLRARASGGPLIEVEKTRPDEMGVSLRRCLERGPGDLQSLVANVTNLATEKFDRFVDAALLARDYVSRMVDEQGALAAVRDIVDEVRAK